MQSSYPLPAGIGVVDAASGHRGKLPMNVTLDWFEPVLSTPSMAAAVPSTSTAAGPRLTTCTFT